MVNLILKFVACSRAAGLRISTSEVLDCLNQLQWVDVMDEPQFAAVLRANFAKSRREQHRFDHLYHLFFHELRDDVVTAQADSLSQEITEIIDALTTDHMNGGGRPTEAILDLLAGEPAAYMETVRQIQTEGQSDRSGPGANLGALTRRLGIMLELDRLQKTIPHLLDDRRSSIHWETRRDLADYFSNRLDTARRLLRANRSEYDGSIQPVPSYAQRMKSLGETYFASLTQKEIEEMRAVIERLVRKLKDTVSRRFATRHRGTLDVKKTLRAASAYQGIPLEIIWRRRPLKKGKIVTLCDVSGSVWSAARFMLNMLYSLQECFTQVRSFVFVAGLDEVTEIFKKHEINRAIDKILKEAQIDYNASTDYGLTFRQFKKEYLDILNKKTTLIIIGDGRSNYTNPEEDILGLMRERSRRVIWLNPETEQFWYSGDSEMRLYRAYCHEVRPCQNLNQLTEFIKDLVM
jgi:uncharacterized protein with von Willebrand factor type A (vWA) domain